MRQKHRRRWLWFPVWILGMLHGNHPERFEREFNMTVITTVPNVSYKVLLKSEPDQTIWVQNPTDFQIQRKWTTWKSLSLKLKSLRVPTL